MPRAWHVSGNAICGSGEMDIVFQGLTLVVGVATGVGLAWLVLSGVMTLAFRRPQV